jgi:hypothetical protein
METFHVEFIYKFWRLNHDLNIKQQESRLARSPTCFFVQCLIPAGVGCYCPFETGLILQILRILYVSFFLLLHLSFTLSIHSLFFFFFSLGFFSRLAKLNKSDPVQRPYLIHLEDVSSRIKMALEIFTESELQYIPRNTYMAVMNNTILLELLALSDEGPWVVETGLFCSLVSFFGSAFSQ